jgi:alkylhydroperoxidase/carboxymuconolactone decarboxylase family protein YurZ
MTPEKEEPTTQQVLGDMLAKRGYLLAYHRLIGESDPGLLTAYDDFYTRLTLDARALTMQEREIVWIALIAATRETYATHHFDRGEKAGLGPEAMADAAAIAGACEAFEAIAFTPRAFGRWVGEAAAMKRYLAVFDAARGQLPAAIAEIAAVVCHASERFEAGMRVHLPRAFAAGATRAQMAEALSYLLLHRGGPTMIDAAKIWDALAPELGIPGPF